MGDKANEGKRRGKWKNKDESGYGKADTLVSCNSPRENNKTNKKKKTKELGKSGKWGRENRKRTKPENRWSDLDDWDAVM